MDREAFLKLALGLPEAASSSHLGTVDIRVRGKIFAQPPGRQSGMAIIKLTSEQQDMLCSLQPDLYKPEAGHRGRAGWTRLALEMADDQTVLGALWTAWRNVAPKSLANAYVGSDRNGIPPPVRCQEIHHVMQEARSARSRGQAADALRSYLDASALARNAGDKALLAHSVRHCSELYLEGGSAEAALDAGDEAVTILSAVHNSKSLDLANALRATALALEALDRAGEAALRWNKARKLYAALDVREGVAECDRYLGPSASSADFD